MKPYVVGGLIIFFFIVIMIIMRYYIIRQRQPKTIKEAYQDSVSAFKKDANMSTKDAEDISTALKDGLMDELGGELDKDENFTCPADRQAPCKKGFITKKNKKGELCCYVDPKTLDVNKAEMVKEMATQVIKEVAAGIMLDFIASKLAKKLGMKAAMKTVGKQMAKLLAKSMVKMAVKIGAKLAVLSGKLAAKTGMGPAGWAMMVFDIASFALDMWDPAGYNKWISNELNLNMRNVMEYSLEEIMLNDGEKYPILAHYSYDMSPEMIQTLLKSPIIMDKQLEYLYSRMEQKLTGMSGTERTAAADAMLDDEAYLDEIVDEFTAKIDKGEYDNILCKELKKMGKKVKWVEGVGCSLDEAGCKEFNDYNAAKPEPKKDEDDERMLAVYTNMYRARNMNDPGDNKKPNMLHKKLSEKVCLISPMTETFRNCKGNGTWNQEQSMCDFSAKHCDRFALKRHTMEKSKVGGATIHNCKMYPGQKVAEFIFGTTITRSAMKAYKAVTDFKSHVKNISKLLDKTFSIFNGLSDQMADSEIGKAALIMMKFGKDTALKSLKLGKDTVNEVLKLVRNPKITREYAKNVFDTVSKGPKAIADLGEKIISGATGGLIDSGTTIVDFGKDAGNAIADGARDAGNAIADGARDAGNEVVDTGEKIVKGFGSLFR